MFLIISEIYLFLFRTHVILGNGLNIDRSTPYGLTKILFSGYWCKRKLSFTCCEATDMKLANWYAFKLHLMFLLGIASFFYADFFLIFSFVQEYVLNLFPLLL